MDIYALTLHDALATLLSGSLAFALVKSLETLAAHEVLTQVALLQKLQQSFYDKLHTDCKATACLQEDCTHVHRPIVCPDMAIVQVLADNTVSQTEASPQALATLPMLHGIFTVQDRLPAGVLHQYPFSTV